MIESSHLSKVYRRGVYAVRDLSLTLDYIAGLCTEWTELHGDRLEKEAGL